MTLRRFNAADGLPGLQRKRPVAICSISPEGMRVRLSGTADWSPALDTLRDWGRWSGQHWVIPTGDAVAALATIGRHATLTEDES